MNYAHSIPTASPRIAVATALLFAFAGIARAASFDCVKAMRPVERAICADPKLSAADTAMATAYRADLQRLPSDAIGKLRVDQLQWLDWLQTVCRVDDAQQTRRAAAECMQGPYDERTKLLHAAVTSSGDVLMLTRTAYLSLPWKDQAAYTESTQYTGFDTLIASWPEAQSEDADWAAWNKAVLAATQAIARQDTHSASTEWNPGDAANGDAQADTRILGMDGEGRITTQTSILQYRQYQLIPVYGDMTWLMQEHRALRASDVFRDGTPWADALAKACWEQLLKAVGKEDLFNQDGKGAGTLLGIVPNELHWHPEPEGLRIVYPGGAITPLSVGVPPDSIVPWDVLKPYLQPGFALPTKP
jgi:uncharacterized protein